MTQLALRSGLVGLMLALGASNVAQAQIESEQLSVKELGAPEADWVWLNDIAFKHMPDGRAYLVDAGEGELLGMLSAGYGHSMLQFAQDGSAIYNVETYYARGTRGVRTDVLTIYDPHSLSPTAEVVLPPKRFQGMPSAGVDALTDDGRFSLVYNFTPAQSFTVVDMKRNTVAGEYDAGGCSLVFPTGPRRFFMLCGDGGLLRIRLDDTGAVAEREAVEPVFDPQADPLTEKPVRIGNTYYFVSFLNQVYPFRRTGERLVVGESWSLTTPRELEEENWRIGGIQLLAAHEASRRLYALMHQGGPDTHKDPGGEVWVFDIDTEERVRRIELERLATAIAVSQGDDPLLYAILPGDRSLHVLDAVTGERLRTVGELGATMTTIQTPPVRGQVGGKDRP